MERKLASIRKIKKINAIDDADNIEMVTIDGWNCVSKKGDFNTGELCVYFEIDSFLPIKPEFEFLRKSSYRKMGDQEGFRLKTIKLRGIVSQGLVLPLSILNDDKQYFDGDDVTEVLGVTKFEPPIPAQLVGKVKGNFPSFLHKTDQERIQNIWDHIKDIPDFFEITTKLDGTSCTYYYLDGKFGVCSRNLELEESEDNTLWKIAREKNIEELLRSFGKNIALQGEVIGEGIQKNPEKLKGQDFYLFDIWLIDSQRYLLPAERLTIWDTFFKEIKHVPRVDFMYCLDTLNTMEEILNLADGPSLNSPIREGIVFKSLQRNISFKIISNKYLLESD